MSNSSHLPHNVDHQQDNTEGQSAHLDALEETVNRQIDADTRILLDNFGEMINLSRVR